MLDFTGSLCVPAPRAMNELRNGRPSMALRTLTVPRVLKNADESGMTAYVQPPVAGDFCGRALKRVLSVRKGLPCDFSKFVGGQINERGEYRRVIGLGTA